LNANLLFCRFKKNLTLCMTKLRVVVLCFSYFTDNSITTKPLPMLQLGFDSLYALPMCDGSMQCELVITMIFRHMSRSISWNKVCLLWSIPWEWPQKEHGTLQKEGGSKSVLKRTIFGLIEHIGV
jgi:hypothetical protein